MPRRKRREPELSEPLQVETGSNQSDHDEEVEEQEVDVPNDNEDADVIVGTVDNRANISVEEAWGQLKLLVSSLRKINKAKAEVERKRFKRDIIFKHSWMQIIDAIGNHAGIHGLAQDQITLLWEIVASVNIGPKLRGTNRKSLLLCMVPNREKIPDALIESIIDWVVRIDKTIPIYMTTAKSTLEYLTGLLEYDLLSPKLLRNHLTFGLLFSLHTYEALIPWVCRLLTQISSSDLIQRCYVLDLLDMLGKDISAVSRQALHHLLRYYKELRPYLVPNDLLRMNFKSRGKKLDLDTSFRKRLFEAKARSAGTHNSQLFYREDIPKENAETRVDARHLIFPEFQFGAIDTNLYSRDNLMKMTKLDIVRATILSSDTVFLISKDPEAVELFNTWVAIMFHHKFNEPDRNDLPRYKFVLEKCIEVTTLLDRGLNAVDCWLPDYFLSWDGYFCRNEILSLLSYMNAIDFEDGCEFVLESLENLIIDGGDEVRIKVWEAVGRMAARWAGQLVHDKSVEPSLKQIFEFMDSIVCKFAALDEEVDARFLCSLCKVYCSLIQKIMETKAKLTFDPYPPTVLWWMTVLTESLVALESFCKLQKLCQAFQRSTNSESQLLDKLSEEVDNFCTNEPGSGLTHLFKQQLKLYKKQEKGATGEKAQVLSDINHKILDTLTSMNAYNISCLKNYREESKKTIVFNKLKLKANAPNLVEFLEATGCIFK